MCEHSLLTPPSGNAFNVDMDSFLAVVGRRQATESDTPPTPDAPPPLAPLNSLTSLGLVGSLGTFVCDTSTGASVAAAPPVAPARDYLTSAAPPLIAGRLPTMAASGSQALVTPTFSQRLIGGMSFGGASVISDTADLVHLSDLENAANAALASRSCRSFNLENEDPHQHVPGGSRRAQSAADQATKLSDLAEAEEGNKEDSEGAGALTTPADSQTIDNKVPGFDAPLETDTEGKPTAALPPAREHGGTPAHPAAHHASVGAASAQPPLGLPTRAGSPVSSFDWLPGTGRTASTDALPCPVDDMLVATPSAPPLAPLPSFTRAPSFSFAENPLHRAASEGGACGGASTPEKLWSPLPPLDLGSLTA